MSIVYYLFMNVYNKDIMGVVVYYLKLKRYSLIELVFILYLLLLVCFI